MSQNPDMGKSKNPKTNSLFCLYVFIINPAGSIAGIVGCGGRRVVLWGTGVEAGGRISGIEVSVGKGVDKPGLIDNT